MDALEKKRQPRTRAGLVITLGLVLCPGCVTTGARSAKQPELPPVAPVHQVHSYWMPQIMETADVANRGAPLPGLTGRLWLMGPDLGRPVKGNGKVIVDLFDAGQAGPDGQAKMLQRWEFDKDTLNRLLRKDYLGWGYTLFLPWPEYRAEVKRVQLKICYLPEQGGALFAPDTQVSLRRENTAPPMGDSAVRLAAYANGQGEVRHAHATRPDESPQQATFCLPKTRNESELEGAPRMYQDGLNVPASAGDSPRKPIKYKVPEAHNPAGEER